MSTKNGKKAPKKLSQKASRKKAVPKLASEELLAPGGGSAPAAGVPFQGAVGALFAASGMAPQKADERLSSAQNRSWHFVLRQKHLSTTSSSRPADQAGCSFRPRPTSGSANGRLRDGEDGGADCPAMEALFGGRRQQADGTGLWIRTKIALSSRLDLEHPKQWHRDLSEALSRRREGSVPPLPRQPQGSLGEVQRLVEGGLEEVLRR